MYFEYRVRSSRVRSGLSVVLLLLALFIAAGYPGLRKIPGRRAIAAFGNAGCRYDDVEAVQLTPENRNFVQVIQRAERAKACSN